MRLHAALDRASVPMREPDSWRLAALVVPVVFAAALVVHATVLEQFPNSGDEYAYLWQANAFAAGRITAATPTPEGAFRLNHIGDVAGRRFSKYPPGWPLLLAAGARAGMPGVVNPLLAALALAGIFRLGCSWVGRRAAMLGVAATATSPFFLLNAGSYHSHPSCLFAITVLALGLAWTEERPGPLPLVLAGAGFGLAVLIRPYTAVLLGVPLLAAFAPGLLLGGKAVTESDSARTRWLRPVWFALGGLPFAGFLLSVNHAVSGSWWTLPWTYFDPTEKLGFGPYGHTFGHGVRVALRLCGEGILYTSFLGPVLLALACGQTLRHKRLLWVLLAAPVAGYVFWWSNGGNRYGPRFYFEALLPFALLAGAGFDRLWTLRRFRAIVAAGTCLVVIVFSVLAVRVHTQIHERRGLYRTVEAAALRNAVVLVTTGSGDMVRSDLTRNPPDLDRAPVLYGMSRDALDREVQQAYPGRAVYRYRWTPEGGILWRVTFD